MKLIQIRFFIKLRYCSEIIKAWEVNFSSFYLYLNKNKKAIRKLLTYKSNSDKIKHVANDKTC